MLPITHVSSLGLKVQVFENHSLKMEKCYKKKWKKGTTSLNKGKNKEKTKKKHKKKNEKEKMFFIDKIGKKWKTIYSFK